MDQIIELIRWSSQPDNNIQKQVYNRIHELCQNPQFLVELTQVLIIKTIDIDTRYRAGVILKSTFRYVNHIPPQIEEQLLQIDLTVQILRQTYCLIIPEYVIRNGIGKSIRIVNNLILQLDTDPVLASDCFSKIIEDMKFNSENINFYDSSEGLELSDRLIIKFFQLIKSNDAQIVLNSLNFLNYNVFFMPPSLSQNCEIYVSLLIEATKSKEKKIKLKGLQGLQALVETKRDKLFRVPEILELCYQETGNRDKEIAKYATLFLTDFLRIEDEEDLQQPQLLVQFLNNLIPQVILNTELTRQDEINLQPIFSNVYQVKPDAEEEDEQVVGEYTLRQSSTQLIQKILQLFGKSNFYDFTHTVQNLLQNNDFKKKESGVLALGYMAEAAVAFYPNNIQDILDPLFAQTNQLNEYVFATSLWSISQYNDWINTNMGNNKYFIENYLKLIFKAIESNNLYLKDSGFQSLDSLSQKCLPILLPYLIDVLHIFIAAINSQKVILTVYSSLTNLLSQVDQISNQDTCNKLMQALLSKFTQNFSDFNLCPIYECISQVIEKFDILTLQFLPIIYQACIQTMNGYVNYSKTGQTKYLYQQSELLKRSLDVCSQIIAVAKLESSKILTQDFILALNVALQDSDVGIRQYALSTIGEVIKNSYPIFENFNINYILLENIHSKTINDDPGNLFLSTSNNAAWALGELALQDPTKIQQIFHNALSKLVPLINGDKIPKVIAQNLAVAICRIIQTNLKEGQCYILQMFKRINLILSQCKSEAFKEYRSQSYQTLINIVQEYPQIVQNDMKYFIYSFVVSKEQNFQFPRIVQQYKDSIGEMQFRAIFNGPEFPAGFFQLL
ncbi:hypothetical protein pb186bvf_012048 [Paramecium bursaria]